nr:MAG TPA: hypothetical protein [Inoviridae sp.]
MFFFVEHIIYQAISNYPFLIFNTQALYPVTRLSPRVGLSLYHIISDLGTGFRGLLSINGLLT